MKSYEIRLVDGVVETTMLGPAKCSDVKASMSEVAKQNSKLRLWDLSAGVDFSAKEAQQIGDYGKEVFKDHPNSYLAVVAPSDLAFGTIRMESFYREDGKVVQRVFRSKTEALEWLESREI